MGKTLQAQLEAGAPDLGGAIHIQIQLQHIVVIENVPTRDKTVQRGSIFRQASQGFLDKGEYKGIVGIIPQVPDNGADQRIAVFRVSENVSQGLLDKACQLAALQLRMDFLEAEGFTVDGGIGIRHRK
ncbi:hypothetical protein D3C75_783650 [compost metagenome]